MDTLIAGAEGSPTVLYGIIVPLLLVVLLALVFIPSIIAAPGKARSIGEAVHCYFMQAFGVLLMTVGSLPTVYSVLAGVSYSSGTYFGLLLVFAGGGGIFLWQDLRATSLDAASRAVPSAIFLAAFRIIGQVTLTLAGLSFLLSVTIGTTDMAGWWVMPILMGIYGGLIAWCTRGISTSWGSLSSVGSAIAASPRPAKALPPVRMVRTGTKKRR